ncbi:GNAT family N-acetyltransferase [Microbulbifer sp. JMSA004]|uniref:GNAT family N-acetyltransferase n=1 Tax=unclassified Microbulbifer TaxID=2619833 RepID=UPI0024AD797E|nr:GNAT family N-acetyltransferase [Microbulbifer sp. VAAF005]WHI47454.1 GNAT family N-acetyltransferase [Microbulbifer sp. VAAF005]
MPIAIRLADWNIDRDAIRSIREAVFVQEQQVPADLEWDDQEETSQHFLVFRETIPVATGRLTQGGKIGRMAVQKSSRGSGIGAQLLQAICEQAKVQNFQQVHLHAQQHAEGFYLQAGFEVEGDMFYEAGIPHIKMVRSLI